MPIAGRTVLHVDMDAFFVSVELRRRPELAGLPVVVGGSGRRGVVAAASYEARRYGVFSAMPSAIARRRCPQAVFLDGDYAAYAAASRDVHAIFQQVTPLIEPLALDEAFLDVSGARALFGDGVTIARRLRRQIDDELHLACSVGVAPNKFLAKLASVEAKPRAGHDGVRPGPGVFEVRPGHELTYLHALPVRRLWGVGPKTLARLQAMGVETVGDLAAIDRAAVVGRLGRAQGEHLLALAGGHDDRAVEPEREVKSISHEETFPEDLYDRDQIRRELVRLADAVASRLRAADLAARTLTVKVRDGTFATVTRSVTLPGGVDTAPVMLAAVQPLVDALDLDRGVRLLGLGAARFAAPAEQLRLDVDDEPPPSPMWDAASAAIDGVRRRFGTASIGPASAVRDGELRLVRKGEQQWGPGEASRRHPPENLG